MPDKPAPATDNARLRWPDTRGWLVMALFLLTLVFLAMIHTRPQLLDSAPFMQMVGTISGAGGLGLVLAFYFGDSRGGQAARQIADKALDKAPDAP